MVKGTRCPYVHQEDTLLDIVTCIDLSARWGKVVNFRLHPFIAGKGPSIHFYESWWNPYLVWTLPCRNKSLAPTKFEPRFLVHPACRPAHTITIYVSCNDIHVSSSKAFSCRVLTLSLSHTKNMWKQHKELF